MQRAQVRHASSLLHWPAVLWAWVLGTLFLFLLLMVVMPIYLGGEAANMSRLLSSLVIGEKAVSPTYSSSLPELLSVASAYIVWSFLFVFLLTTIIHRWGLVTGLILGGLYGWAMHFIMTGLFSVQAPWLQLAPFCWSFIFFGSICGGVYELLDEDEGKLV